MTRPRCPIHALVDLSGCDSAAAAAAVERLQQPDALGLLIECASVAIRTDVSVPAGWIRYTEPKHACDDAFGRAAAARAHLLVVFEGAQPASDAVSSIIETVSADPMFGFVHPRFSDVDGRRVACPMAAPGVVAASVARRALATVPAFYVTTECLSPCFLVRRELVGNLYPTLEPWKDVRGVLTEYAVRARRIGFRTVVSNRSVVPLASMATETAEIRPVPSDEALLKSRFPDFVQARTEFSRAEVFEAEYLVSQLFDAPGRWLLDARNIGPYVDGTVKAFLGLCDAFYARHATAETTLWVRRDAADFHELEQRYTRWSIVFDAPADRFAAAVRLSQPWSMTEALDLGRLAAVNVFLMLDTIAWDIVYAASPGLDATWQYVATHSDGILFISEFSRQRFLARFATSPGVQTGVVHLSLDVEDYLDRKDRDRPDGPYWLVVGNTYDHKHVRSTLDLLTRAFPTRRFVALGDTGPARSDMVTRLTSGATEEQRLQSTYAGADVTIYPSFYEGFGLPIVNALAWGCTVVARESALVREIAAAYHGPGRLVTYADEAGLIDSLCRLVHGRPVPEVPLGDNGAGRVPAGWAAASETIVAFVDRLIRKASPGQMRARAALVAMTGRRMIS
jgi:glycosyltransferase involved in cell wall biosynthesis